MIRGDEMSRWMRYVEYDQGDMWEVWGMDYRFGQYYGQDVCIRKCMQMVLVIDVDGMDVSVWDFSFQFQLMDYWGMVIDLNGIMGWYSLWLGVYGCVEGSC